MGPSLLRANCGGGRASVRATSQTFSGVPQCNDTVGLGRRVAIVGLARGSYYYYTYRPNVNGANLGR